jgi:hypothetical protein
LLVRDNQRRAQSMLNRYQHEIILFCLTFFAVAWFYNGANWNHISRFDAIFAFVEPGTPDTGTFRIDRFITDPVEGVNTGDWSQNPRTKHYYSNKAPGPALLGIPLYYVMYHVERMCGFDPAHGVSLLINAYLLSLLIAGLPVAMAAVFFYRLMLARTSQDSIRAFLLTLVLVFGTLLLPYSTQLWGHGTAAAFIIMAVALFYLRRNPAALFCTGMLAGWAVLCEYSAVFVVATLLAVLAYQRRWRSALWLCGGGLLPLVLFAIYHKICFDSCFTVANFYNNPVFTNPDAVVELFGRIKPEVIFGLTLSSYRGLFICMPVLGLAVVGMMRNHKRLPPDSLYWLCVANITLFMLMNLTFNGWHGGTSFGPRYQIPALCFYVILMTRLPLGALATRWLVVLLIISATNMIVATAVTPMIPPYVPNPLKVVYLGFSKDLLTPYILPIGMDMSETAAAVKYSAFNLGELMGLRGRATLLPWLVITAAGIWWAITKSDRTNSTDPTNP